jgi:tRNA (cytidine/uridine-2'-O-)-methyltransferase
MALHIVMFEPQNHFNFSGVVRTAALLGADIHVIGLVDFVLGKKVRRFSMGYLEDAEVMVYQDWQEFSTQLPQGARLWLFSDKGASIYSQVRYQDGDYLVFGRESSGLPPEILAQHPAVAIPMPGSAHGPRRDHREHSLNVSVSVAIAAFEAMRQLTDNWQQGEWQVAGDELAVEPGE